MLASSIPTIYSGLPFTSCLEARWAVLFDLLGLDWKHKPAPCELRSGLCTPDFLVQAESGWRFFTMIRPGLPDRTELVTCFELWRHTGMDVAIFCGGPMPQHQILMLDQCQHAFDPARTIEELGLARGTGIWWQFGRCLGCDGFALVSDSGSLAHLHDAASEACDHGPEIARCQLEHAACYSFG